MTFNAGQFLGAVAGGAIQGLARGGLAGGVGGALQGLLGGGLGAGQTMGFGPGGGMQQGFPGMGVQQGGAAPQGVAYSWNARGQVFYRLSDGRISTQKRNGLWKTWRPRRNIVIGTNPRINSARRVIKLARRLERRLPAPRRPRVT